MQHENRSQEMEKQEQDGKLKLQMLNDAAICQGLMLLAKHAVRSSLNVRVGFGPLIGK